MVQTSEKVSQTKGNLEDKKRIKLKRKENKLGYLTIITLHNLEPPLLNWPALFVRDLDKLSCRVMEQATAVQNSYKTDDSSRTAMIWARCSRQKIYIYIIYRLV